MAINLINPPSASKTSDFTSPPWQNWFARLAIVIQTFWYKGPPQYTTALAPPYVKGAIYFDTTLNKLRVGGASGWETVTSV